MGQCWENINPMRDQCSVQTFPVKSGFSRVCVREKERKKMVDGSHDDASTIQPRYFAVCTRLRAVSRYKKYKNLAISRQFATTHDASNARRAIFYFSLCEKQQRHANISRKTLPFFLAKIYFFPRTARDFNIRLASKSSCEKREFRAHSPLR